MDSAMVDSNATRTTLMVPDVKPLDHYDFTRAKICASLGWLLAKSYGSAENVPVDLWEPFYRDQYEQEHMKPPVSGLLLSGELYCRTYGAARRTARTRADGAGPPGNAAALLRLLAGRGLSPRDQDATVTEADLQHKPIRMSAHLAVIDALMSVGAMETVSAAKIPSGAEQLGGGAGWENALLYWVNRVNQKLREITETAASTDPQPSQPTCPSRWYWKLVPSRYRKDKLLPRQAAVLLLVSGVKDLSDGVVLAAIVHFYCPSLLSLEDVCVKDTMSVADSTHNLQLIREFCDSFLKSCCPLVLEDLLYSPPMFRVNILSLVAELLDWFEVRRPDFVQPLEKLDLTDVSGLSDYVTSSGGTNNGAPPSIFSQPFLPISAATPGSLTQSTSVPDVGATSRTWTKKPFSRPLSGVSFSIPFGLDSDVDVVMGNPVGVVPRSRASWGAQTSPAPPGEGAELPTIEEALQIIHNEAKLEPRLHPEGARRLLPALARRPRPPQQLRPRPHGDPVPAQQGPARLGRLPRRRLGPAGRQRGLGRLRGPAQSPVHPHHARPGPARPGHPRQRREDDDQLRRAPEEASPPPPPPPAPAPPPPRPHGPPGKSPALNTEMTELGARLEEKRRAIEAQKRRIEAIFQKHRQRLGKSALLQLSKRQREGGAGEAAAGEDDPRGLSLEEKLASIEDDGAAPRGKGSDEARDAGPEPSPREKGVGSGEEESGEKGAGPGEKGAAPLGDYNNAVSRLTAALSSLQSDMQRLSQQQSQLIRKKASPSTKAWVIPASPTPPRLSRESTRDLPSPSPSPARKASYATPPKSPQVSHRRAQSAPPKSPKQQHHHARPLELKFPPLARVLTPPQNVDTLPHLRRVTPGQCQVQTASNFSIGTPRAPWAPAPVPAPADDSSSETGSCEEASLDVPAAFGGGGGGKRGSLVEISLSSLRGGETDDADDDDDSVSDQTEPDVRGGVGFFFKDEARPEDEMAQRRAALLEKQQKRAEEIKRRREQERESRPPSSERSQTPTTPPPTPRTPPPPNFRRGDFTRLEYQHRHQLKIMEDLDKVLRQKPTTVRGVKKQRPKTLFRDDSALSPPGAPARPALFLPRCTKINKVYSHSTLNLSTLANDTSNTGSLTTRKSPSRSHSPARLKSPSRLASQNGDDWDIASTVSSPASIPEYTGPKLYKEPSFKSNKFIIHNALSRCCLAGKVNEPQKNKILEEMEKCTANHFLILFRDTSCQFRAVYAMNPETEEMVRVTGIGPRVIGAGTVESIYKYSSDRKQFTAIPSKTMSMSVDAFTIPGHLWQKRPGTPKKLGTPK
ncbi:hypothetical protein AAFF_G00122920 [Aldrovandia affinis]|uniref:Calmodulin regulated spectrin associated protein family member 3 n=1 Tax=Aldrovandia affinis TaxID=143900 RepID=A0AAD7RRK2_9TELE|nr:hypothetical protein AAFF_G00122920 [Aldrovandia affinis]